MVLVEDEEVDEEADEIADLFTMEQKQPSDDSRDSEDQYALHVAVQHIRFSLFCEGRQPKLRQQQQQQREEEEKKERKKQERQEEQRKERQAKDEEEKNRKGG